MGLNQPVIQQYAHWLAGMLHGDWGVSLITGTPVSAMLSERAGNTALLAVVTVAIAIPLAVGLGVLMSLGAGRSAGRLGNVTVLGLAADREFRLGQASCGEWV